MKKFQKKPLSLNKFAISKLNAPKYIKGGNSVEGSEEGVVYIETTRISQFPMICDPNLGTIHYCEPGETHGQE